MKNIKLLIAYDGTNFCGWQRQPGSRTVCGELESALARVCGTDIKLDACSRTDAGVHAHAQCASFKADIKIPAENLAKALNNVLSDSRLEGVGEIRVLSAEEMPEDFHARFSSHGKRYIYKIKNNSVPDVFCKNYCYEVFKPLNTDAMRKAAAYLVGKHDFAAFQSAGSPKESTVRSIYGIEINENGENIEIAVSGSGFLYNMVRIIVGTLVEAGLGKRSPESVLEALNSKDRSLSGFVAPASGLYLDEIFYNSEV